MSTQGRATPEVVRLSGMPLRAARPGPSDGSPVDIEELLRRVSRGDTPAFETLYDRVVGTVYGVIRRVLRDPAQSEEVTQEVMVEIWRTATRFDADRGSLTSWILTMAHRRAIDRVRSEQSSTDREQAVAAASSTTEYDEVAETVTTNLEVEQVRHCLSSLTELQRESVTLAYYGGYSYREVAELLDAK